MWSSGEYYLVLIRCLLCAFHLGYDSLESLGIVESEVGEHFTVDFDTRLVDQTHKLGVREIFHTCSGVDTLDPESAEVALFVLSVAVSVCKTFLPCIFGYSPYVTAAAVVTTGEFEDLLSFST